MPTAILRPTGPGAFAEWLPSPAPNWQAAADQSDTSSNFSDTTAQRDRFQVANLPADAGLVKSVKLGIRAQSGVGIASLQPVLRLAGSEALGVSFTVSGVVTNYLSASLARPGGGYWSVADVNALQAGYDYLGPSSIEQVAVYECWLEVAYVTRELVYLTDWRNPPWSTDDRKRLCGVVSCSNRWTEKPIPYAGVTTLAAFVPYTYSVFGNQIPQLGDFNEAVGEEARAQGWNIIEGITDRILYANPPAGEYLYCIDIRNSACQDWIVSKLMQFTGSWCDGWHSDYWTDPLWLESFADLLGNAQFLADWKAALVSIGQKLRVAKPGCVLIGQQFHLVPDTQDPLTGQYVEQYPTQFDYFFPPATPNHATEIATFKSQMAVAHPERSPIRWVLEHRDPNQFGQSYRESTIQLAEDTDSWISWGRDATAGGGAFFTEGAASILGRLGAWGIRRLGRTTVRG